LDTATSLGYEKLATGHYVNIVKDSNGKLFLSKAKDKQKDQSYFLWSINKDSLSRLIFPLGDLTKSEIRELAQKNGLVTANRPDSQDICFIKNGEYASFIKQRSSCDFPCGDFVDVNGNVLGKHEGIINYTVGQRKGLGMAFGVPMFVGKKNASENTVTLCTNDELFCDTLTASNINLFVDDDTLDMPVRLQVKIRYRHEPTVATVRRISDDELSVKFDVPQRAITPGQSVVLYDGDTVIGGGMIN
jgi:tRNA-specific 2-thiouridylase